MQNDDLVALEALRALANVGSGKGFGSEETVPGMTGFTKPPRADFLPIRVRK
jgi:hypothetical protein